MSARIPEASFEEYRTATAMRTRGVVAFLLAFLLCAAVGIAEDLAASRKAADEAFRAQKWDEAARAYAAITREDAADGESWYRLAYARHLLGDYQEAVDAYVKADELGFAVPFTRYNLAASLARLKRYDQAFAWLDKAVSAGFRDAATASSDEDLVALRTDARWTSLMERIDKLAHPCREPRYRRLDFWVGDWEVVDSRTGSTVGGSRIESILDGCVVLENWNGARGGTGKSFNTIDPTNGKWRQTWADSSGQIFDFIGEPGADSMIYSRSLTDPSGHEALIRMTLSKQKDRSVRQLSERSDDGGRTWSVAYDFIYRERPK